jgi:hypothetical protein
MAKSVAAIMKYRRHRNQQIWRWRQRISVWLSSVVERIWRWRCHGMALALNNLINIMANINDWYQ